ncbi:MAG: alpha/beta hydrolase [Bauldia sp.]|nr:alpha/beta hydrolase [Bauldia sp.]
MTDTTTPPTGPRALDSAYLPFLEAVGPTSPAQAPTEAGIEEMRAAAAQARLQWKDGGATMDAVVEEAIETPRGEIGLRVYYPHAAGPLPTLVYFHGGGWALLDNDTHDRLMREYAAASGWAVIGVAYPRAPEVRFPGIVTACTAAIETIRQNLPRLGLIAPLALAGDSAGANLALSTAIALRDSGATNVDALILNYGVYDGTCESPSYAAFSDPPLTLSRDRMAWFWDLYCPDPEARRHPLASPLFADLAGLPPVRLVTTGVDVLRDENLAMAVRLFEAGNALSLDHHPHAPHAFVEALALHPEGRQAIAAAAAWLNATVLR